jgi:hypothetical protein
MQRILSSGTLVEVVPYQATAVEDFEDGSLSAEDEEQMALLRLNNDYFRVAENTMDRLVLRNRPFWFSTCVGIFFLVLSSVLVLPFFVIIWSATWDIVIFDRPRDLVAYRRRSIFLFLFLFLFFLPLLPVPVPLLLLTLQQPSFPSPLLVLPRPYVLLFLPHQISLWGIQNCTTREALGVRWFCSRAWLRFFATRCVVQDKQHYSTHQWHV